MTTTNEIPPRKGDIWKQQASVYAGTATFLDNGDSHVGYSVTLDGPTYFKPCHTYMTLEALTHAGFAP